jgi:thymidylate synthase ThyX
MNPVVKGKNGISAQVVQASRSPSGKTVYTFNVTYGLIVHAEQLRHRLFSNSVKSNRAIPMKVLRKEVLKNPYVPVWMGKHQKGMVADKEVKNPKQAVRLWKAARYPACVFHWVAEKIGAHKEWANRLLNPWQFVSQTITATEFDNFFVLRLHKDAQKDIQELAQCMYEAKEAAEVMDIKLGEYHVPYVDRQRSANGTLMYFDNNGTVLTKEQAVKCSAARVARSSYNNHDKTSALYENDIKLYNMLIESKPTHASPVEAQCTPFAKDRVTAFSKPEVKKVWQQDGATHIDSLGNVWSGNLKGFCQVRQTLDDHCEWGENQ